MRSILTNAGRRSRLLVAAFTCVSLILLLANHRVSFGQSLSPGVDYVLYVDWSGETSMLMAVQPSAVLGSAVRLLTVDHAASFPVNAATSARRSHIGYTRVPPGRSPHFAGEIWQLEAGATESKVVDTGVEAGWAPRWAIDDDEFLYIKLRVGSAQPGRHSTDLYWADVRGNKRLVFTDDESLALFPIGLNSHRRVAYVQRVTADGDALWAVDLATGAPTQIARLSLKATWNLRISNDGEYAVGSIVTDATGSSFALVTIQLSTGRVASVAAGATRHYTGIWTQANTLLVDDLQTASSGQLVELSLSGGARVRTLGRRGEQIHSAPVAASADNRWVVMKTYAPTGAQLAISDGSLGSNAPLGRADHVEFAGWINLPAVR